MLNLNIYLAKAKYSSTNRVRKVKVYATSKEDATHQLTQLGYLPPFSLTRAPDKQPTERQIELCKEANIDIPANACCEDVSALLTSYYEYDEKPPSDGLKEFATNHKIIFSSYSGKKLLYDKVFSGLDIENKIAFFIFSVYRYLSDDRESNLDVHPHREIFYDFAREKAGSKRYINSLIKYRGRDLRFFGTLTFDDYPYKSHYGGRTDLMAYRDAKQYLIDVGAISPYAEDNKTLKGKPLKEKVFVPINDYNIAAQQKLHNKDDPEKYIQSSYEGLDEESENFINPYYDKASTINIEPKPKRTITSNKNKQKDILFFKHLIPISIIFIIITSLGIAVKANIGELFWLYFITIFFLIIWFK